MAQNSNYEMVIHTRGDLVGHFSVELKGPGISDKGRFVRGFAAENFLKAIPGLPINGFVRDDLPGLTSDHYLSSQSITLSREQAIQAYSFIEAMSDFGPGYDLNDYNCVDFVNDVLQASGLPGNVDHYLTAAQKQDMNGARFYNDWKYSPTTRPSALKTKNPFEEMQKVSNQLLNGAKYNGLMNALRDEGASRQLLNEIARGTNQDKANSFNSVNPSLAAAIMHGIEGRSMVGHTLPGGYTSLERTASERAKNTYEKTGSVVRAAQDAVDGVREAQNYAGPSQDLSPKDAPFAPQAISDYVDSLGVVTSRTYGPATTGNPSRHPNSSGNRASKENAGLGLSLGIPSRSAAPQDLTLGGIPNDGLLSAGATNQRAGTNRTAPDPFSDISRTSAIEQRSQAQREQEAQQNAQATAQHNRTEPQAPGKEEAPSALSPITKTETVGVLGADLLEENAVSKAQRAMPESVFEKTPGPGYPSTQTPQKDLTKQAQARKSANMSNETQSGNARGQRSGSHDEGWNLFGGSAKATGGPITNPDQDDPLSASGAHRDDYGREIGAYGQFTQDIVGRGDGSAEAGNTRVICTELVRQGLMPPNLQRLDIAFTLKYLSPATVRGYHFWAVPYVRLMKRSSLATRLVEPLARWRAEEIAYRMKARSRPHWRGRVVRLIGEPLCWALGVVLGWTGDSDRFYPGGVSKPGQG